MCDNQVCIVFVKKPTCHFRTKHINVQHHFIREKLGEKYKNMLEVLSNGRYGGRRACKNTCKRMASSTKKGNGITSFHLLAKWEC